MSIRVNELPPDIPDGSMVLMRTGEAHVIKVREGSELTQGATIENVEVICAPTCTKLPSPKSDPQLLRFELSEDSGPVEVMNTYSGRP